MNNVIAHIRAYVVTCSSVSVLVKGGREWCYQCTTNTESHNCTLLTFVSIWCLDFPLFSWAGLWLQFTATAFHSRNFDLILPTRWFASSKSHYRSLHCEARRRNPGTPSQHSGSCCCHIVQWPYPSLQASIFTDRYLQFKADSMCHCTCDIYVQTAPINRYHLMVLVTGCNLCQWHFSFSNWHKHSLHRGGVVCCNLHWWY